jgi:hypothetical protein
MTVDCKSATLGEVAEQCAFSASGTPRQDISRRKRFRLFRET